MQEKIEAVTDYNMNVWTEEQVAEDMRQRKLKRLEKERRKMSLEEIIGNGVLWALVLLGILIAPVIPAVLLGLFLN